MGPKAADRYHSPLSETTIKLLYLQVDIHLYKDLYHTLFESYLTYGISVWGGSPKAKLLPLFKAEKKVMRVIFGDRAKYLDKFKTCAQVRPLN